jgi:myxalamid-type polyketide synthase MxaB
VARLYVHGFRVDWANFDKDYPRRVVPLPTYPFQPARHWIEADRRETPGNVAQLRQTRHPYLGQRVLSPLAPVQFLTQFSLRRLPQVKDHVLRGMPWVNLVIYLEMALAAAAEVFGPGEHSLAEVKLPRGLVLGQEAPCDVQLVLTPHEDGNASFQIFSLKSRPGNAPDDAAAAWTLHAAGKVLVARDPAPATSRMPVRPEHVCARCPVEISGPVFYETMRRHGAQLGPSLQWIERVWRGDGEALGRARTPGTPDDASTGYHLCIGPVDACFQLLFAVLPTDQFGYLLSSLKSFRFFGRPAGSALWCQARRVSPASDIDSVVADAWLFDESGAIVAEATCAGLQSVTSEGLRLQAQMPDRLGKRSGRPAALDELQATPADRRQELLTTYLLEALAEALETPVAGLDPHMPLAGQLDSLMAVDLKSRVEADLPLNIPVAVFFDGGSLANLASVMLEQLRAQGLATATSDTAVPDSLARLLEEVEQMSENEAQARLAVDQPGGRWGRVDE